MKENSVVSEQTQGMQKDFVEHIEIAEEGEASAIYEVVKQRMLDVNHWHEYAGTGSAVFQLVNERGEEIQGIPTEGDYFKIDIPGPGTKAGQGFDWVKVEAIEQHASETEDVLALRVRPAANPVQPEKGVAHFLDEGSTSTFLVRRKQGVVQVEIHGRNEKPNTEVSETIDKARNVAVASGAILGLANIQWTNLAKGLIRIEGVEK